jgi:hypothetical protein
MHVRTSCAVLNTSLKKKIPPLAVPLSPLTLPISQKSAEQVRLTDVPIVTLPMGDQVRRLVSKPTLVQSKASVGQTASSY